MKFTIEKNKLLTLLKLPSSIIENTTINPVLTGLLMEVKNNQITIISTNNHISVKSTTNDLKIESEGKVLIHGKLLYNIVNKLKETSITLEVVDSSIIRITTPSFSSDLNLLDNVGYPTVNFDVSQHIKCEIPNQHLKKVIHKLINTTNVVNDHTTPLNGILFDTTRMEGYIESIGTDGHHLSYLKTPYVGEKFKITIGVDILKTIQEQINDQNNINFYLKNNQLIVETNNILFNCRLIEGEYPSAIKAIETNQQFHFLVNKQEIFNAIERGIVLASADKKPSILFNISPKKLKLSSRSIEYGSSYEEVSISEYSGDNISVSFNAKYISNLIKNIEHSEILVEFTANNKQFFFKNPNDSNYLSLILPIRMI
ncbi:MAG: DNA polymerase III subunit beta [Mycoplasmataceae bacterium]|jgi:DNA polymerase-3 subunit beta|nr:DNA polymerase III subunit beta [Mycoplasmataceae bacterium]